MENLKTIAIVGFVLFILYALVYPFFDTSNLSSSRYCDVECQAQQDYANYKENQEMMRYR